MRQENVGPARNHMPMAERPWWQRLDGMPPWMADRAQQQRSNPQWWDSPLTRVGFIGTIIWGGGAIVRFAFPERLGGGGPFFALLTIPWVIALVVGIVRGRNSATP